MTSNKLLADGQSCRGFYHPHRQNMFILDIQMQRVPSMSALWRTTSGRTMVDSACPSGKPSSRILMTKIKIPLRCPTNMKKWQSNNYCKILSWGYWWFCLHLYDESWYWIYFEELMIIIIKYKFSKLENHNTIPQLQILIFTAHHNHDECYNDDIVLRI